MLKSKKVISILLAAVMLVGTLCGTMITANAATTTDRVPAATAKCKFYSNDGKSIVTKEAVHAFGGPSDVYMLTVPGAPAVCDDDKVFAGWSTDKNATSGVAANSTMKVPGERKFYAVYAPKMYTVTVVLNANGSATTVTGEGSKDQNAKVVLPASGEGCPVRAGYTFLGWSSVKNAKGPMYRPGESYDAGRVTEDKTVTFYAVWAKN